MITLLKSVSTPIIWVFSLLIIGILLLKGLRKDVKLRIGWYLLTVGTSILFFLSLNPISNLLVYSLESQYQSTPKEVISKLDIIVILGGGVFPSGGLRKSPEASGVTYSRLFNGVEVFKQSAAKVLVLSGAGEGDSGESNAGIMKTLAIALGVPADKIITECKSRNTMEHAIELAKLFPPTKKMQVGIVTSALHMSRAVQAFQKKFPKENIAPIPVGFIYSPLEYSLSSFVPTADAFMASTYAIHEYIGMIWYGFLSQSQ